MAEIRKATEVAFVIVLWIDIEVEKEARGLLGIQLARDDKEERGILLSRCFQVV